MVGPALPTKPSTTPKTILETGSTLLYPLMGAWTQAYQKQFASTSGATKGQPYATIDTGATGSGTGLADAASGTVDIGASDAYLSSSAKTSTPSLVNIALAISAQQINYNLPGIKNLKLDATVLAGMYNGKITTWNDPAIKALNPGVNLPSMKVVPLHREDSSGDTFLFTSFLNAQAASDWPTSLVNTTITWPKGSTTAETGNGGMVSGCQATKGCVAYIGISYLQKTQAAGLGTAMLKNAAGQVRRADFGHHRGRRQRADGQDPAQRDAVADQRAGRHLVPDHQLRVRDREHQAVRRHQGRGHPGLPALDGAHGPGPDHLPGPGGLPAAAVQCGQAVRRADRQDRRLTTWLHQHQAPGRPRERATARSPACPATGLAAGAAALTWSAGWAGPARSSRSAR